MRRLIAALIAGCLAFSVAFLALAALFGEWTGAAFFASAAFAIGAAVAAATVNLVMSLTYGVLGAAWLLLEGIAAAIALAVACLS